MANLKEDPELFDDPEEGVGDDTPVELPEYDHAQFEVSDEFEWVELEEGDDDGGSE